MFKDLIKRLMRSNLKPSEKEALLRFLFALTQKQCTLFIRNSCFIRHNISQLINNISQQQHFMISIV